MGYRMRTSMSTTRLRGRLGVKVLVCITCLSSLSCSRDILAPEISVAEPRNHVRILSIHPAVVDSRASFQEGTPEICEKWTLTGKQAEQLFALSKEVDQRTYIHTYDTAPCKIEGTLEAGGDVLEFSINGAAKAEWFDDRQRRYFGCESPLCEPLVMWPYYDPRAL